MRARWFRLLGCLDLHRRSWAVINISNRMDTDTTRIVHRSELIRGDRRLERFRCLHREPVLDLEDPRRRLRLHRSEEEHLRLLSLTRVDMWLVCMDHWRLWMWIGIMVKKEEVVVVEEDISGDRLRGVCLRMLVDLGVLLGIMGGVPWVLVFLSGLRGCWRGETNGKLLGNVRGKERGRGREKGRGRGRGRGIGGIESGKQLGRGRGWSMDMVDIMVHIMRGLRGIHLNLPHVLGGTHLLHLRLHLRSDLFRLLLPRHHLLIRILTILLCPRIRIRMRGVGGMIRGVIRGITSTRPGVILFRQRG